MSRFSSSNFRSLNESIQNLNSTNRITELEQYVDMLESVLISIAEQMECDTEELVEMAMTKAREKQLAGKMVTQSTAQMRSYGTSKHPSEYRKSQELQKQYGKEDKSKKTYGINGKVVKEESELDEMAVTAGRGREHEAKINSAETKAYRFMNPDNRKGLFGKDGKAKSPAALKKGKELEKGEKTARSDYDKEVKSKKLFDKGGKVVTKGKAATFVNGMRMTRADMRRAREEGND